VAPQAERSARATKWQCHSDHRADLEFDNGSFDSMGSRGGIEQPAALAAVIDNAVNRSTRVEIVNLCDQAIEYRFACVMVNRCGGDSRCAIVRSGIPVGVAIGSTLELRWSPTAAMRRRRWPAWGAGDGHGDADRAVEERQPPRCATHHSAAAVVAHHHGAVLKVIWRQRCSAWKRNCAGRRSRSRPARTLSRRPRVCSTARQRRTWR